MPASTREIGRRIKSVKSTKQITKAMELVASAKLRRAIESAKQAYSYEEQLTAVLAQALQSPDEPAVHPLLAVRPVKKTLVVAINSNQGLAGSYNSGVAKRLIELKRELKEVDAVLIGRKIEPVVRHAGITIVQTFHTLPRSPESLDLLTVAAYLTDLYRTAQYDEIRLVSTLYVSGLVQEVTERVLMPLTWKAPEVVQSPALQEPSLSAVLDQLVPQIISAQLYGGLLQSLASEHANRRRAMHSATDNAETMIEKLRLRYNRVRQTAITTEIAEITGGAAALAN